MQFCAEIATDDDALQFLSTVAANDDTFVNRPSGDRNVILKYSIESELLSTSKMDSYSGKIMITVSVAIPYLNVLSIRSTTGHVFSWSNKLQDSTAH